MLLVNPSFHTTVSNRTLVLLDGSASMTDVANEDRWHVALDSAQQAAGKDGRIMLFGGTEPRFYTGTEHPDFQTTLLLPALKEAAARGDKIVIVTDGMIDDAASLPQDLLMTAHVIIIPKDAKPDAGIASFDLPEVLRAGDTAIAAVDVAVDGAVPGDSATLELIEEGRTVSLTRIALPISGSVRRQLSFVPLPVTVPSEVRRYEIRVSGFIRDAESRDNVRQSAAAVSQASAIALFTDSPDWDFRWLTQTLVAQSGVPVHGFVRLSSAGWRESRTMQAVTDAQVRAEASNAALVIAHGTEQGAAAVQRMARRAMLTWITVPSQPDASAGEDWYVATPEFASPVGGALAGVPAESLPPLESVIDLHPDSVAWTGLVAQVDRRGRTRPVVVGAIQGGRRMIVIGGSGIWRWASRGGIALQAYRALTASMTDWLLEQRTPTQPGLTALRDSLSKSTGEFLPRRRTLGVRPGQRSSVTGDERPVRFGPWLYAVALVALVIEWVARRRRGLR